MILLFGALANPVIAFLCDRLDRRGEPFLLLDARRLPDEYELSWGLRERDFSGRLCYGSKVIPLEQVRSIYLHQIEPVPCHDEPARPLEWYESLMVFLNAFPRLVVNRPASNAANLSKPWQRERITGRGFRTPRTLITTIPDEARRFCDALEGQVVYKSIGHHRSVVRRITDEDRRRFEDVAHCPTQFQQYVPGTDVRVHTIGARAFATEVQSSAVDYRHHDAPASAPRMRAVDLPRAVERSCLGLAADFGMFASGIDLRRTPDGIHFCFEINPAPGFVYYQEQTGQRIGDTLVEELCRPRKPDDLSGSEVSPW